MPRPKIRVIRPKSGKIFPSNYYPEWAPAYKEALAVNARNAGVRPSDESVLIMLAAHFELPKYRHQKTRKVPESWHCKKPDVDNIAKMVMDGLQGVAYTDDSRACALHCEKVERAQGEDPFLEVWVLSPFLHRQQFVELYTSVFFDKEG